jgi:hypothetical protein
MEGMWKMMDEMHTNDPEEYKKYVDKNMTEMKDHNAKEKVQEDKKSTINSEAYFTLSIRPSKIQEAKPDVEKTKASPEVKLFDF